MPLKNHRSESTNTFDKIQKCLATHGAQKIMFDYGSDGRIYGIAFQLLLNETPVVIKLPARIENVALIMYGGLLSQIGESKKEQAYRTAWANIRDWIDAQMAMLDTKMVKMEEIFLPYVMRKNGDTYFEHLVKNPGLLIEEPKI